MITLRQQGTYRLIETKRHTKILYLDNKTYAWIEPVNIGEILVASHRRHRTDSTLSKGTYCIYEVKDEAKLSDHIHMELEVGEGSWQGYILLSGLPNRHKIRTRIIPTKEVITTNKTFIKREGLVRNMAVASG